MNPSRDLILILKIAWKDLHVFPSIAYADKVHNSRTRHLRRWAIFLFSKCCFALGCISNEIVIVTIVHAQKKKLLFSLKELQLCSENCLQYGFVRAFRVAQEVCFHREACGPWELLKIMRQFCFILSATLYGGGLCLLSQGIFDSISIDWLS